MTSAVGGPICRTPSTYCQYRVPYETTRLMHEEGSIKGFFSQSDCPKVNPHLTRLCRATRCGGRDRRNPFGEATPHGAAQLTAHWAVEQNCAAPPFKGGRQGQAKNPLKIDLVNYFTLIVSERADSKASFKSARRGCRPWSCRQPFYNSREWRLFAPPSWRERAASFCPQAREGR